MYRKLILTAFLCISAAAHAQEKALAETGINKIHNYYQGAVKRLSIGGAKIQDIEMACMGEIYLEWYYVFKGVIKRTDGLFLSEVNGYREAEQKAHLVEQDRKAYDMIRADVSNRILAEVDKRRGQNKWPAGPANLTLEQPKDQELIVNLRECTNEEFVAAIRDGYNLNENYPQTRVTIQVSAYVPDFKPGEKLEKITPVYGAVEDKLTTHSATYEEWLYEILSR